MTEPSMKQQQEVAQQFPDTVLLWETGEEAPVLYAADFDMYQTQLDTCDTTEEFILQLVNDGIKVAVVTPA